MRTAVAGWLALAAVLLVGCSGGSERAAATEALRRHEVCLRAAGVGANDIELRYATEPAFRKAFDECSERSGVGLAEVTKVLDVSKRANTEHLTRTASCMRGRWYAVEVETIEDGSSTLGDMSKLFGPDTLDEFFDDFAACNGGPRADYPTEEGMEAARRADTAG